MAILALLAALAATSAAPGPLPAPLTPAAEGKAQCFSPNLARKICTSMDSYAAGPDGRIANTASVILEASPMVIITTTSTATVAKDRVCTVMTKDDLQAAKFTVNGATPDDDHTEQLRQAILSGWAAIVGHAVCVSFVADGSQFVAHTAFDGLPRPNLDQRMMWVSPGDGWKVGS